MTFTLTFAWWWIPAAITVVGLIWAFKSGDGSGWFSTLAVMFNAMLVLAVSGVAWAIAGFMK